MSKLTAEVLILQADSMVTLGRFELPTCGLGNRLQAYCTKLHNEEIATSKS